MSEQKLSTFEKDILSGLSHRPGLAAALLDAWSEMLPGSTQSARTLVDLAQLGVTEEQATQELLLRSVKLSLLYAVPGGFRPRGDVHAKFKRLALALNAVEHFIRYVHQDSTIVQVVLTKPPSPSALEKRLSEVGWRTSDIEPTEHAFQSMVSAACRRVVVMTPFLDVKGATWLQELFSAAKPGVEQVLILRTLESPKREDYPVGYDNIASWLKDRGVRVMNYSLPRSNTFGRETFHAKVVLCDSGTAYLGSSNMTSASLEHSMEMGVALKGRAAADVAVVVEAVMKAAVAWA
ncbi:MAG: phospholipase D-like domain-containing protein [Burkholderiales bacterium]